MYGRPPFWWLYFGHSLGRSAVTQDYSIDPMQFSPIEIKEKLTRALDDDNNVRISFLVSRRDAFFVVIKMIPAKQLSRKRTYQMFCEKEKKKGEGLEQKLTHTPELFASDVMLFFLVKKAFSLVYLVCQDYEEKRSTFFIISFICDAVNILQRYLKYLSRQFMASFLSWRPFIIIHIRCSLQDMGFYLCVGTLTLAKTLFFGKLTLQILLII